MRVLTVIFFVLVLGVLFIFMSVKNIDIKVKLTSINLDGFLASLLEKKPVIKVGASVTIHNTNFFSIPISNLLIEIYDGDTLIARSVESSKRFVIPKEQYETFNHSFDVFISTLLLDKIKQVQAGQKIKFMYKIRGKIFGFPVRFKNQYNALI